jgi:hypothetical protein
MGAERWLDLGTKAKADRVRAYLGHAKTIGDEELRSGTFLAWKCGGSVLELGYSFGGNDETFAMLVGREIAKRFPVRRIGADSVGWYRDDGWKSADPRGAPARYGPFVSWVDWLRAYDPIRFSHDPFVKDDEPGARDEIRAIESRVVAIFQEFDARATGTAGGTSR